MLWAGALACVIALARWRLPRRWSTRHLAAAALWLVPIAGAIFGSFRPFSETVRDGFFSWPQSLTLDNYRNAWEQGDIARKYWNTALILVPALILTLFFSSMVAFVCSRFTWRLVNVTAALRRVLVCSGLS